MRCRNLQAMPQLYRALMALLLAGVLGACATARDPDDPLEGYNRAMFAVNDRIDKAILRPAAQAYEKVTPLPVRAGVGNFFGNIEDLWTGANNLLQGKPREGLSDLGRVLINSTLGILGVFDIATEMGLERHEEDFGQTLGRWGVGEGAYVVLPIFGPRTVRDAGGLAVDISATSSWTGNDPALENSSSILRLINTRARLLTADKILEQGALDRYAYVRGAYLQRRRFQVYDGRPPREPEDDYLSYRAPGAGQDIADAALGAVLRIDLSDVDSTAGAGAQPQPAIPH